MFSKIFAIISQEVQKSDPEVNLSLPWSSSYIFINNMKELMQSIIYHDL